MKLILASRSRGRAALLKASGYVFDQIPSDIEEPAPHDGAHLERYVRQLAVAKAKAVARRHPRAIVVGADTALILGRRILGKPASMADATRMLAALAGRTHRISSAACVIFPAAGAGRRPETVTMIDTARVTLRRWPVPRLRRHVRLTRPLAWAGAYAVQDSHSAALVSRIRGDLATVIGLPMQALDRLLRHRVALARRPAL